MGEGVSEGFGEGGGGMCVPPECSLGFHVGVVFCADEFDFVD